MTEIDNKNKDLKVEQNKADQEEPSKDQRIEKIEEIGGPKGKEPTRYGDWEKNGRCSDF